MKLPNFTLLTSVFNLPFTKKAASESAATENNEYGVDGALPPCLTPLVADKGEKAVYVSTTTLYMIPGGGLMCEPFRGHSEK